MNEKMAFPKFKAEIKRRIKKRNDNLESLFNEHEYGKMAAEFTPNTRLVTHEGYYIAGENSEDYWRKVGGELKGKKLKFIEKYFDAMELILSPDHTGEDIDFVALEVTEFSFDANEQEYSGYIDPPFRHKVKCEIDWLYAEKLSE